MESLDLDVLRQAQQWLAQGQRVYLTTVLETWGSAPRQPGAMAAIRQDGVLVGSVSGGCIEDDLIQRTIHGELPSPHGTLTYSMDRDNAIRFGLPCGGSLSLFCEDLADATWLPTVLQAVQSHRTLTRRIDLTSGQSTLQTALPDDQPGMLGNHFQAIHGPRWRLLIIGANQTGQALAEIATMLNFHVLVCDPRSEFLQAWQVAGTTLLATMPDDTVLDIGVDARTAIVTVTHDPKLDDMALLEALKSPAFFVGALGSQRNSTLRRERLALFDLTPQDIARLHGPIGLDIQSRTPAEIAVSIAAQLVQLRNSLPHTRPVLHNAQERGVACAIRAQ